MTLQEMLKLVEEDSDGYKLALRYECKLICPDPRAEAVKNGIPCLFCGSFLDYDAKCHNKQCELYFLCSE
jgi:hypothetical protein